MGRTPNKAGPWNVSGIGFDAREAAQDAARRAGLSLGEWLASIIAEHAAEAGVDSESVDHAGRIEAVTARLARMSTHDTQAVRRGDSAPSDQESRDKRRRRTESSPSSEIVEATYAAPARNPEPILEEAIRRFEHGVQTQNKASRATKAAISEVTRRLENIEVRLTERDIPDENPVHDALVRLETRLDTIARRSEQDADGAPLRALEQKITDMAARLDKRPSPPSSRKAADKSADSAAPETKRSGRAKAGSAVSGRASVPRGGVNDAIARITRRQRDLDRNSQSAIVTPGVTDAPEEQLADQPQVVATAGLEEIAPAVSPMPSASTMLAASPMPSVSRTAAGAVMAPLDALRAQIQAMQQDIATLAPREGVASIEGAIGDLARRVEGSRQVGVREAVLRPVEELVDDVKLCMTELAPSHNFESIEHSIQALYNQIDTLGATEPAAERVEPILMQAKGVRSLLATAIVQRAPLERIEHQISILTDRVDALTWRGDTPVESAAVLQSIGDIRGSLREAVPIAVVEGVGVAIADLDNAIVNALHALPLLPVSMPAEADESSAPTFDPIDDFLSEPSDMPLKTNMTALDVKMRDLAAKLDRPSPVLLTTHRFEEMVHTLGAKIDDAVARTAPVEQVEMLSQRIDRVQHEMAAQLSAATNINTSALESMMRDLAGKLDRTPPAAPADTAHLEEMLNLLSAKLEGLGAQSHDMQLVESLQGQIGRLSDKIDSVAEARANTDFQQELKDEFFNLAARLEADAKNSASDLQVSLETKINQLSLRLDSADETVRVLSMLEGAMNDLFTKIDDARSATADVAHAAARETLLQELDNHPSMKHFNRELEDLRAAHYSSEQHAAEVLTTVHDTLEKVVERLAILEQDFAATRPDPSAHQSAAPVLRPAIGLPEAGKANPVAHDSISEFSGGEPIGADGDELIEPGTGYVPGSGYVQARTSGQADQSTKEDKKLDEGSSQADFIAAARRAALAASAEPRPALGGWRDEDTADAAPKNRARAALISSLSGTEKPSDSESNGALARVKQFVSGRRRPLLGLASAAAVLASVGAIRFIQNPGSDSFEAPAVRGASVERPAGPTSEQIASSTPSKPETPAAKSREVAQAPSGEGAKLGSAAKFAASAAKTGGFVDTSPVGSIGPQAALGISTPLRDNAENGNAAAQYELGGRYADGRGVTRDQKLASAWLQKAADQNFVPAQYRLGTLFERGIGVDRNLARARTLYLQAAQSGNTRAMHNLGVLSAEGVDDKPDYATAATWFRKAAEYGVRDSQYNLAILYARGLGTEQNLPQSWAWFSVAAAQGDDDAARKRDDVGARMDAKQLSLAKALVDAFHARTPDLAANEVAPPPGGWDAPTRSVEKRSESVVPQAGAPNVATSAKPKAKVSSL